MEMRSFLKQLFARPDIFSLFGGICICNFCIRRQGGQNGRGKRKVATKNKFFHGLHSSLPSIKKKEKKIYRVISLRYISHKQVQGGGKKNNGDRCQKAGFTLFFIVSPCFLYLYIRVNHLY